MATNIGPKIGIDGEAEYRKSINHIIQQARTLDSEMKLVTASFDENATVQERAEAQAEILAKQIRVQEERVAELSKMLEMSATKYSIWDEKTLKWQQAVNESKTVLYGMQRQLDSLNAALDETDDEALQFDETAAKKALSVIEQQARTLASEMKLVTAEFDDNASAQERLAQKKTALSKQIDLQKSRVAALTDTLDKATAAYGENDSKTLKWQQALNEARLEQIKMERELRDLPDAIDDVGNAAEDAVDPLRRAGDAMDGAGAGALSFGDALKAGGIIEGGKAVVGIIVDLIERTKEYRTIMASLEVSSARAGYTAEETAAGYALLYGVLGDEQSAATALANLQALKQEQGVLQKVINGSVGAWAAYGDSINISTMAESVNETVKGAKAVSAMSDILVWAGKSEDEFNAKLAATADHGERVQIVLQELTDQGLVELGEAWQKNNKDLVDANNAANDMTEAYARMAEMAAPAVNMVQQQTANLLNGMMDLMEGTSQLDAVVSEFMERQTANAANLFGNLDAWTQELADSVGETVDSVTDDLKSLIDRAATWGKDFMSEYRLGILGEAPNLELTVQDVADMVASYLHFSVPDIGPLSDADEYGPDFMQLLANGIRDNIPLVSDAAALAADAMVIQPRMTTVGSSVSNVYRFDGIHVNVYGAEGQSVTELADAVTDAVMDRIQYEVASKEAVFGG